MISHLDRHEHQIGLGPKLRGLLRSLLRKGWKGDSQAEESDGEYATFHRDQQWSRRKDNAETGYLQSGELRIQAPVAAFMGGTVLAPTSALKNGSTVNRNILAMILSGNIWIRELNKLTAEL